MQRTPRGLDVPLGTANQEAATTKCFQDFLALAGMDETSLACINDALTSESMMLPQNFYSLLTAFSIYLQTRKSSRVNGGLPAEPTAIGYMSQVVNFLRERYPAHMQDSKRIGKIRDKMASAIEERNLLANIQTMEAPGCTLADLQLLAQELAIGGVGLGYKNVHDAAILTLMCHTFGRAIDTCFARKSQLTYKDPDLPVVTPSIRSLKDQLPAIDFAQLMTLRRQLFRNVTGFTESALNVDSAVLDAAMASLLIHLAEVVQAANTERRETGYTSHYIYRFYEAIDATNAALDANLTMGVCIGWGARMLTIWKTDSFVQVGDLSQGDTRVLSAAITQILATMANIERAVTKLVDAEERRNSQERNSAPTLTTNKQKQSPATPSSQLVPVATTLAGAFCNWYAYALWNKAAEKKQQFVRADLKACVNIMSLVCGQEINIDAPPSFRDQSSHQHWLREMWALADDVDRVVNLKLHGTDGKKRTKKAGSLPEEKRAIIDNCSPMSYQWDSKDLQQR